jgi:RNA polymerase sigma factor (TIGR02999 family)
MLRNRGRIAQAQLRYKGPAMVDRTGVTALLLAWSDGDDAARSRFIDAVYDELRRLARGHLRRERQNHSLAPTALVHEAYCKLIDQRHTRWENRAQFFAIAARIMRRILVDHARTRGAAKRGAGATVRLDDVSVAAAGGDVDVLALDVALEKLARIDERQCRLVELRFFAGLTVEETAAALDVAPVTVKRDWALARAWLFRELQAGRP